jgi:glycosyltransferase involved in cell wall biosynthesis
MSSTPRRINVFMMDLWAIVPYYTAYLSKALLKEPVNLTVGSISYYLDPTCFTGRGIKVEPGLLDVVGRYRLPKLPRRILKMIEAAMNLSALTVRFLFSRPDVVHVQYLPMLKWRLPLDFWFLEFLQWRGSKIVLTVHDLLPHDTGDEHKRTFQRLYETVDRIICHSDHVRARLGEEFAVTGQKVSVIPHGPFFYDLRSNGLPRTAKSLENEPCDATVLWQGIIFPYKGIDLLLNAWKQVEAKTENACLIIAGTGAPEFLEQIRGQVKRLDMKRVRLDFRFVSTEELVALYRAATVVVYPYRMITTSGALATGLALGKAIVASDLPVFRELLTDHVNALLVNPQNSDELAGALIKLTQNFTLREQLEERVRQMNFGDQSWSLIAAKTMEAYEAVLSGSCAETSVSIM